MGPHETKNSKRKLTEWEKRKTLSIIHRAECWCLKYKELKMLNLKKYIPGI